MKKNLLIACLLLGFTVPALAQGQWQVIFRGHATDRLRGYGMTKFPDSAWHVEDSSLVAQDDAPNIDLVTKDKFKNFELMFEWRVPIAGNSGIFFHVVDTVKHESGNGNSPNWLNNFEMQLLDDIGFNDTAAIRSAGSLYDLIIPEHKHLKPVGQWNNSRLLVKGNHVEHWLNGDKVVSYDMNSPELNALIAKSNTRTIPTSANRPTDISCFNTMVSASDSAIFYPETLSAPHCGIQFTKNAGAGLSFEPIRYQ